jgi:hypothetical protein
VKSGSFAVSRKVDSGEFAMQSTCGLVVCVSGMFFGVESAKTDRLIVGTNRCIPLAFTTEYALEPRRPLTGRRVHHVLLMRDLPKILSSVVQTIATTMIHLFGWLSEKIPVKENRACLSAGVTWCSATRCVPSGHTVRCSASAHGTPVPTRHVSEVSLIDEGEHSLRQRDPSSIRDRRRRSGCTNSASATTVAPALSAAFVAELPGSPGASLTFKRCTAFDAGGMVHCSPPSVSADLAPVVDATRGRFNGGYHGFA